ncbi:MAG: restriction endonuclease subunit S [Acinetobacter junii]
MTQIVKIGNISTQIRGVSYSKSDAVSNMQEGYLPVLRANNIQEQGLILEDFVYVPESKISKKQRILAGDVIIAASSGSISLVGKAASAKEDINAGFGAFCKILRPNTELVDPRYFANYFQTQQYRQIISNLAAGANINNLKNEHLDDLEIPLPPLSEQRRIASILDQADVLRQKRQQAIEKLDQLLQATFIDMFGDPVSNPKGWEVKKLSELSTKIHSGNTPKGGSENYVDQGIIFLRSQNVWKNKVILDDVAYIDAETHSKMMKSSVKHEDLLMTKTGRINTENSSLGRAAIYLGEDDSANINGHVYLIRIKDGFNKYFILRILTLHDYYEYIRSVCVGGIDKRQLNKEHIENFPIIQPPMELQNKFSNIVQVIESQKPKLLEQLDLAENLFKTLLQKAFNGTL